MKRYLAFYGDIYYPSSGMGDFIGDFDTVEEAVSKIEMEENGGKWAFNYGSVYDSYLGKDVWHNPRIR
jgi:hypothetical protein